ncbi:MAG TPA: hypothetical protein GX725_02270 [Mollicutes bacterium]|nr:hypothetical protein [Mollicutes bacterium]
MYDYFAKEKYIKDAGNVMSKIFANISLLTPFAIGQGFVDKLENAILSLTETLSDNEYDELIDYNKLYAYTTEDYVAFNYYGTLFKSYQPDGTTIVESYNLNTLYWNYKTNEIYFFSKDEKKGYNANETGYYDENEDDYCMSCYIAKYYLEEGKPVIVTKKWNYDVTNSNMQEKNPVLRLVDSIVCFNKNNEKFLSKTIDRIDDISLKYY